MSPPRVSVDRDTVELLGPGITAAGIAVDDTGVYSVYAGAVLKVPLPLSRVALAVGLRDQFFFTQMRHIFTLNVASRRRSFCTARNTDCLAALGGIPIAVAISSVV